MHQSEKDSKPTPFKHKFPSSTSPPIVEHVVYKSSTSSLSTMKRMDGKPPAGIGTKGTVGSLVLQEIEYFRQLEMKCREDLRKKPEPKVVGVVSTISFSKPNPGARATMPKKKKKGSSRIIPSMCSMVDVVEKKNQSNLRSRFSYRSLEADVKTLQF
ncbi:hypothetical protein DCAR_0623616 [Daucus carota subsp. sativus]|uniref:Uncharacterized protein n=1 Tax=Daucus carota subsp. sativus TaxID=79200 RepID=A0A164VBD7_DAUCS|nr:hypothetical protein DCAR_0623616 [Daucus carota subsp. sativus]